MDVIPRLGLPGVKYNPEVNLGQIVTAFLCVATIVGGAATTGMIYSNIIGKLDTITGRLNEIDKRAAIYVPRVEALERSAGKVDDLEKRAGRAEADISSIRAKQDAAALVDTTQNQRIENLADSNAQTRAFLQDLGKTMATVATDVAVIKVRQEMGGAPQQQQQQRGK